MIQIWFDGGSDFPNFDEESNFNVLKFETEEKFISWSIEQVRDEKDNLINQLFYTLKHAKRGWQVIEGDLMVEWNGETDELCLHGEDFNVQSVFTGCDEAIQSESLFSVNSYLPSIRKHFGNGVDWVAERIPNLKNNIINMLKEKAIKMPASDLDAFLKHQNVDEIKELCEGMYHNGEISRTSNYRYFVLTEEKFTKVEKSEAVDVKSELNKFKEMLDDDLITQDDYDAKKKELLGL